MFYNLIKYFGGKGLMKKILSIFLMMLVLISIILPNVTANDTTLTSQDDNKGPFLDKIINFLKSRPLINRTINFFKGIFGMVDDLPKLPNPDEMYEPYLNDNGGDPKQASPTDNSISVTIKDFDIAYETTDDQFEFEISFNGKTSGTVYACYWTMIVYFDDGTNSFYNLWNGPATYPDIELYDNKFELTFTGTGPGGDTDWSSFEGRQYVSGKINDQSDIPFDTPDDDLEKYPVDALLFVRAYSDEELTQWNQDSKSIFNELTNDFYTDTIDDDDSDEEDSPIGMEFIAIIFIVIVLVGIVIFIFMKKK